MGSEATKASEVTLDLFLPFSLVLVLIYRPLLLVGHGSILLIEWASELKIRYRRESQSLGLS